jgi:hypothetical protein
VSYSLRVLKYRLTGPRTVLSLPEGARVLHIAETLTPENGMHLWAETDPTLPSDRTEQRVFLAVATGERRFVNEGTKLLFLGTVVAEEGRLVWHMYEGVPG